MVYKTHPRMSPSLALPRAYDVGKDHVDLSTMTAEESEAKPPTWAWKPLQDHITPGLLSPAHGDLGVDTTAPANWLNATNIQTVITVILK